MSRIRHEKAIPTSNPRTRLQKGPSQLVGEAYQVLIDSERQWSRKKSLVLLCLKTRLLICPIELGPRGRITRAFLVIPTSKLASVLNAVDAMDRPDRHPDEVMA
jgi:hypothetical protein